MHVFLCALSFYEHLYLCISVAPPDPQPTGSLGILPLISTPGTISTTYCIITSYININIYPSTNVYSGIEPGLSQVQEESKYI